MKHAPQIRTGHLPPVPATRHEAARLLYDWSARDGVKKATYANGRVYQSRNPHDTRTLFILAPAP